MNREYILEAITEFIDLIDEPPRDPQQQCDALIKALDNLAYSMRFIDYNFDDKEYPDSPIVTKEYKDVGQLFKQFGYYNIALDVTVKLGESSLGTGDAIDDILDIYNELYAVKWCSENTSIDDAIWYFENSYTHWGEHMRNLQVYLLNYSNGVSI